MQAAVGEDRGGIVKRGVLQEVAPGSQGAGRRVIIGPQAG